MFGITMVLHFLGCSGTEKEIDDTSIDIEQTDTGGDTGQIDTGDTEPTDTGDTEPADSGEDTTQNDTSEEPIEMYFPENDDSAWETAVPIDVFPNWSEEEETVLLNFLEERNTKSFMILHNGYIVSEHYFGDHTQDSIWYWASAGKTLTSSLVGLAQQEGFMDIHEPVSTYLGTGWTSASPSQELMITSHHLLTMTSGIDERNGADLSPENLEYRVDAGTRWAYHNVYSLLQNVVEEAAGQSWRNYFRTKLRNPIGMGGSWTESGDHFIYWSDTRSMARFGLLALNNGIWKDTQIINEAYFTEATQPSQDINPAYGYFWWLNGQESFFLPGIPLEGSGSLISSGPDDMVMALGTDDQKIYVVPSSNMVVIRMGESGDDPNLALSPFDVELWEKLSALTQ